MDVHFETTGCRLNQIESEGAARLFTDLSFSVSLNPLSAKSPVDESTFLCVINTCSVTQKAEQKDRRIIRLVLEKCPSACVVVTGCYAQLSRDFINSMDPRIAALPGLLKNRIQEVAFALDQKRKAGGLKVTGLVDGKNPREADSEAAGQKEACLREADSEAVVPQEAGYDGNGEVFSPVEFARYLRESVFSRPSSNPSVSENAFAFSTDSFLNHSRASIKIQDGCNCACSYCTIHTARGKSISLDVQTIIDRVRPLEKAGLEEVVFTAVNIAQYRGSYNGDLLDFGHLLKLCLKNTEKIAFRISSLYPETIDDYFLEVIKDRRVRPHFHISVQSGSNRVLKNMRRAYSRERLIEVCSKLRESKENPFIACDIITGFPGESEEDFNLSELLVKECNFSWVHVFPFSPRPGTPAFSMTNQVPEGVRGERAKKLLALASENKKKYIEECKGRTYQAVLENVKKPVFYKNSEKIKVFHAVTENFLHTELCLSVKDAAAFKQGMTVNVKITEPLSEGVSKGGEIDCLSEMAGI